LRSLYDDAGYYYFGSLKIKVSDLSSHLSKTAETIEKGYTECISHRVEPKSMPGSRDEGGELWIYPCRALDSGEYCASHKGILYQQGVEKYELDARREISSGDKSISIIDLDPSISMTSESMGGAYLLKLISVVGPSV